MDYQISPTVAGLPFNSQPPRIMHLDLNSCFASIEQQANPFLRGKPIAVVAYDSPGGCILAPSIEAKASGLRTGIRVREGRLLCPNLIVLTPDPDKYRNVHFKLKKILASYTADFQPKSIDEFVLNLALQSRICKQKSLWEIAVEMKRRIKNEIGEWLTVSVGIGPNRFLAKTASNLHKPDGLDEINKNNFLDVYSGLELVDLSGIDRANKARLNSVGIDNVLDFYHARMERLRTAFHSILGYYWYLRLRGREIDQVEFSRRSFGNSYALPHSSGSIKELFPILQKLVEKMGARMRRAGYRTRGIHLSLAYRDGSLWHKGQTLRRALFDSREVYKQVLGLLSLCPHRKPVHTLAVSCFNLEKANLFQLELFEDVEKKVRLSQAIDEINKHWGDFSIIPARVVQAPTAVQDRIAY